MKIEMKIEMQTETETERKRQSVMKNLMARAETKRCKDKLSAGCRERNMCSTI